MLDNNIDIEALNTFYKEINCLVGTKSMLKIFNYYRGAQITIPSHLYNRKLAASQVVKLYNGSNLKMLAKKYGYTEKWVRKIVKNIGKIN
ncbi:hypothetical protein DY120_00710 [Apilactobacillus micheneri]|uniref:Mor transcription activator domain-containing protein n=1 Tax=Apilactobacillus micheneri TaxID=1899430 RepID=A0ABY2YZ47_9LACO|nr:Mor transcription activator family protein [Apilactobacillus micheneri]TPR26251.1 hypothetical protein DY114_00710 [Apilactobacillus micheneri]TPR27005.1 hypothetical protein DY111_00710 [Apilactobacillus micheneri]TPR27863.1 hypothetical protein DY113_04485 [Apilactobacillus micheneri]TPR31768.1 hypothetical protein DY117_00710 [Apilactobacillus micheneri]TPR32172.1 hypothetical protein DY120_00710 [Apilactobacillus micheneri]